MGVIQPNLSAVRLSCSACGATTVVGYPPLHFVAKSNTDTPPPPAPDEPDDNKSS